MQCSSPFKLIDKLLRGFQVLNRLPGIVRGIVPLPLDQVFQLAFPCVGLGDHAFHLVLGLSLLFLLPLFLLLRLLFGISLRITLMSPSTTSPSSSSSNSSVPFLSGEPSDSLQHCRSPWTARSGSIFRLLLCPSGSWTNYFWRAV